MTRTQLSAQGSQRRNILEPVRDGAITKPTPPKWSTGSGISRSERLVSHRDPPVDLTSDAAGDSERSFATDEDGGDGKKQDQDDVNEQDQDEGIQDQQAQEIQDQQAEYENEADVHPENTSSERTNMPSTAKSRLVEESIYTVYYEHGFNRGPPEFSVLSSYTHLADANAAVLQYPNDKSFGGVEWDDYRDMRSADGMVTVQGRGEEDNYNVSIWKTRLGRRVLVGR